MLKECPVCKKNNLSELGYVDEILVYSCDFCDSVIANCLEPEEEFYEETYVEGGKFGYDYTEVNSVSLKSLGAAERRRCQILSQYDKVVEIGAGNGNFQVVLRESGISSLGVERSSAMRNIAKKINDVNLFESVAETKKSVNFNGNLCIAMIEVIEHIVDPHEFLKEIFSDFPKKPEAIYFTTPNRDAVNTLGIEWEQGKPPEHVVLYNEKGLELLMRQYGYSVEGIVRYQSVFLHYSNHYLGRRSDKKVPGGWIITAFLRLIDGPLCLILPSKFSIGLEVLVKKSD